MHAPSQSGALGSPTPSASCSEEDTRDNVVARRDVLAALWARQATGLSKTALTACAVEVHLPNLEIPGDGDVVGKITADLHLSGVRVRATAVRKRLKAFHREALQQTNATD